MKKHILKIFTGGLLATSLVVIVITIFLVGFVRGYSSGQGDANVTFQKFLSDKVSSTTKPAPTPVSTPKPQAPIYKSPTPSKWGGPDLWAAVNKSRVLHGVNPLQERDELCTIASLRLNQLLELGKLDGHEGFGKLPTDRPDLKWIFEKYSISEFLVSGATSAQNAVDLWLNSLGHKKLLTGGEYSFGCIYAQNGFGVAIAAY